MRAERAKDMVSFFAISFSVIPIYIKESKICLIVWKKKPVL